MGVDRREATLAEVARSQRGRFTLRQARDAGFPASTVYDRVERGVWREPRPRVFVAAGSSADHSDELLEAVLWARGDDRVAGAARRSAARVHGLLTTAPLHHVLVPVERNARDEQQAGVDIHRSRRLTADRITVVDAIPTTDVAWTAADLAFDEPYRVVRDVAARAIRRQLATEEELHAERARLRGTRAATVFGKALASLGRQTGRARADGELRLAEAVVARGLPEPIINYELLDAGGRVLAELDLAWVDLRIAVEIDEYEWHADPSRKRRDEVRTNRLTLLGWRVLRFTSEDLHDRLEWVLDTIAAALTLAAEA